MAASRNFREVSLHSGQREGTVINFTIGSTTVIKDEDYAKPYAGGGYAYRESGNVDSFTRNRFIVWFVSSLLFAIPFKIVLLTINLIALGNSPIILYPMLLNQSSWINLKLKKLFETRQHWYKQDRAFSLCWLKKLMHMILSLLFNFHTLSSPGEDASPFQSYPQHFLVPDSRPQKLCSFWSAPRIASSGKLQHQKSVIHRPLITLVILRVKLY